ncbi:hypothetical protein Tco_0529087 [Tanacetum coccineum]
MQYDKVVYMSISCIDDISSLRSKLNLFVEAVKDPLEESKEEGKLEELEEEADSDLLLNACSRPGAAESNDYCESKVKPITLRPGYVIEVANGKKVETDRIIRGMDWLSRHKVEIVCHEKVVRIPLGSGKTFLVKGERTEESPKSLKTMKIDEQKLDDIPIVRDFPKVFPEDLAGFPPQQQVEFRIDLVPGATPIAKSPYRLSPSEM